MAKQNEFSGVYLEALDNAFNDAGGFDPTKGLASAETSDTSDIHGSSGVFYNFNVSPTSFDLDPYFFFADGLRLQDPKFVNDFQVAVHNGPTTADDLNIQNNDYIPTSVRIPVTRGPMMLSGWGYDVAGLPVPLFRGGFDLNGNQVPSDEENLDSRNFNYFTPVDRRLWKSGPVDLRWDGERKVWVGGAEFIEGLMSTSLPPGDPVSPSYGSGQIYRSTLEQRGGQWKWMGYTIASNEDGAIKPDPFGEPVDGGFLSDSIDENVDLGLPDPVNGLVPKIELVRIYNRNPDLSLGPGDYFSATKINYEWRIVSAGGGGSCITGKFKRLNCSSTVEKSFIPYPNTYVEANKWIMDFGTLKDKFIYFKSTETFMDIIPMESIGGDLVQTNGKLYIPISENPYFISLVAFENCKYSSDVVTLKVYPGKNAKGETVPLYLEFYVRTLEKLYDCPNSQDCFGSVVDDQSGMSYFAIHPFKFIKHNTRVIACGSNVTVVCQGQKYSAKLITEVDDCANAGTGESRE
jgi:hypothetical protein